MNTYIRPEQLKRLREKFPAGTRVELVRMEDPQAPPIGTRGRVVAVDDIGTIFVSWETGSGIGVAFGIDECKVVNN